MPIALKGRSGLKWRLLPVARAMFRAVGLDWNHFYAWMLNRQERRNSIRHIFDVTRHVEGKDKGLYDLSRAEHHLDLMKKQGLLQKHRTLDFGCGYGRTAIPLLRYLKAGNYVGTDLSSERIRIAKEYIAHEKLEDKAPEFHVAPPDNDMSYLGAQSFDFIWSRAVLSHMPLRDAEKCLVELSKLIKPDGTVVIDYNEGPEVAVETIKDFLVPEELMRAAVDRAGFIYEEIPDWEYDILPEHRITYTRMLRLKLKSTESGAADTFSAAGS